MTTTNAPRRLVEVSGSEALWLLEGSSRGRLLYLQKDTPALRPALHVLEYGRLIVRTPVPASAVAKATTLTYQAEDIRDQTGTGWSVTAAGPAEVITDADQAAHYRRTLPGWSHGPHDTLLLLRPQTVTGFRLGRAAA